MGEPGPFLGTVAVPREGGHELLYLGLVGEHCATLGALLVHWARGGYCSEIVICGYKACVLFLQL